MRNASIVLILAFIVAGCSEQENQDSALSRYRLQLHGKELTFTDQMLYLVITLEIYRTHVGRYPSNTNGLQALISKPEVVSGTGDWRGPYADSEKLFYDPWNQKLHYEVNEDGLMSLRSLGPDGVVSGDDMKASEMFPEVFREMEKLSDLGPIPIKPKAMPTQPQ